MANAAPIANLSGNMIYLLIDNSNTRTKFRLAQKDLLLDWQEWLPTSEITVESVRALTQDISFDGVLLCSVVPEKAAILRECFASNRPFHQVSCTSKMPLSIDYPMPQQIGADRLANAVGVVRKYTAPAIVIDFGTAVTFDVISSAPAYCGGVIAPGLGAMNEYLHRKTALLPLIELAEPAQAIGKSTHEAMLAGAVYGYRGLVKEILAQLTREIGEPTTIIATGGDATLIAQGVTEIQHVDPTITMEGLRYLAVENL
jgi:type III pantothenate kinase